MNLTINGLSGFLGIELKEDSVRCIDRYKEGNIFSIDLWLGVAVAVLEVKPDDDHVLDLGCAVFPALELSRATTSLKP